MTEPRDDEVVVRRPTWQPVIVVLAVMAALVWGAYAVITALS